MISSNKKGVGKSLLCLALASALHMRKLKFAILDGDGPSGDIHAIFLRKVPARRGDFRRLRPELDHRSCNAGYESMLYQLLGTSDHLIINTNDGVDSIFMDFFEVVLKYAENNNIILKSLFLMSNCPDGLGALEGFAHKCQFVFPVINMYFGNEELFSHFNRSYRSEFHDVPTFPSLRGEEVRLLFEKNMFPAEALLKRDQKQNAYVFPLLSRARLASWQFEFNEIIDDIIENNEQSNLKNLEWK